MSYLPSTTLVYMFLSCISHLHTVESTYKLSILSRYPLAFLFTSTPKYSTLQSIFVSGKLNSLITTHFFKILHLFYYFLVDFRMHEIVPSDSQDPQHPTQTFLVFLRIKRNNEEIWVSLSLPTPFFFLTTGRCPLAQDLRVEKVPSEI